ncbi:hypothetical protein T01_8271 [Trichinella spiralis]|uniref:Uncharacterized protein n=1 Tax=Trichinella spiralis TaxID=6334 RepID=A0A0V0Z3P0_TRISP|nr:hypothetical protein T01_8271 [Trichinella spiralis]
MTALTSLKVHYQCYEQNYECFHPKKRIDFNKNCS